MTHRFLLVPAAAAALCLAASGAAQAQSARAGRYSLLPYTSRGYLGLSVGKPDYQLDCAVGYGCVNPWFGVEVGYMNQPIFLN